MGLKQLIQRIIYPTRYSSEALIKHIRSGGGGKVGNNCCFFGSSSIFVDDGSLQYISIGDNVNITRDVIILAHDFSLNFANKLH